MYELCIFLAGILFVSFLAPILDAFGTWIQNLFGAKSVKLQVEAEKAKLEADASPVHAIGFQVPSEVEEDWEDDDE